MKISEFLRSAAKEVEESGVAGELRPAAFEAAVQLLRDSDGIAGEEEKSHSGAIGDRVTMIASKIGISTEIAAEVYDAAGDRLEIIVPAARLDPTMSGGARQLALLVAAGRQAGGYDAEWTGAERIREVCRDFGRFDSANFASSLRELSDAFVFRGKGHRREVRVTRPGWDQARREIVAITGSLRRAGGAG